MAIKKNILFLLLFMLFLSCNSVKHTSNSTTFKKENTIDLKFWHHKDFAIDGIPGVSLERVYKEKRVSKTSNTIIVAVLDTQIDLNHEDLKGQFWQNENEIANNGIDDDSNGYIDDINGWNFVGKKNGGYLVWGNFEYVRIIRKYEDYFKNKNESQLSEDDQKIFKEYKRALNYHNYYKKYYTNWNKSLEYGIQVYPISRDSLKKLYPKENYTLKDLDSVYELYKTNDKSFFERRDNNDRDLGALIDYMRISFESDQKSIDDLIKVKVQMDSILQKNLNQSYNERDLIKDDQNKLEKGYGNNRISEYDKIQKHSTEVSGIISAKRNNTIGIEGFSNNIKIMPLSISISGDEHDKDIAMAIYYAVDNGAKIINMSFGKEFTLNQEWVTNAIKYAEKKNVLIVHVAGNNSRNVDTNPYFPNDYLYDKSLEVSSNFINVGATTHKLDSSFVYKSSNYGKNNVDLFAPGDQIYTLVQNSKYDYDSGTSLAAPMVSGTAALIWLYYPNLSVQEVKQIILESGTDYDIEVIVPGSDGKKVLFKELSKSGKVLNVYNAMKMAKEISKLKR